MMSQRQEIIGIVSNLPSNEMQNINGSNHQMPIPRIPARAPSKHDQTAPSSQSGNDEGLWLLVTSSMGLTLGYVRIDDHDHVLRLSEIRGMIADKLKDNPEYSHGWNFGTGWPLQIVDFNKEVNVLARDVLPSVCVLSAQSTQQIINTGNPLNAATAFSYGLSPMAPMTGNMSGMSMAQYQIPISGLQPLPVSAIFTPITPLEAQQQQQQQLNTAKTNNNNNHGNNNGTVHYYNNTVALLQPHHPQPIQAPQQQQQQKGKVQERSHQMPPPPPQQPTQAALVDNNNNNNNPNSNQSQLQTTSQKENEPINANSGSTIPQSPALLTATVVPLLSSDSNNPPELPPFSPPILSEQQIEENKKIQKQKLQNLLPRTSSDYEMITVKTDENSSNMNSNNQNVKGTPRSRRRKPSRAPPLLQPSSLQIICSTEKTQNEEKSNDNNDVPPGVASNPPAVLTAKMQSELYCPHCDKKYSKMRGYRQHMTKAHKVCLSKGRNKERRFKCDFEGCDRCFYQRSDLRRHQRVHLKLKPFQCGKCKKEFTQRGSLYRHIKAAHKGEEPRNCIILKTGETLPEGQKKKVQKKLQETTDNNGDNNLKSNTNQNEALDLPPAVPSVPSNDNLPPQVTIAEMPALIPLQSVPNDGGVTDQTNDTVDTAGNDNNNDNKNYWNNNNNNNNGGNVDEDEEDDDVVMHVAQIKS